MEVPHRRKSRWTLNMDSLPKEREKTELGSVLSPRYVVPNSVSEAEDSSRRSRSSLRRSLTVVAKGVIGEKDKEKERSDKEKSIEKSSDTSLAETPRNMFGTQRRLTLLDPVAEQPKPPRDELDTQFEQMMVCSFMKRTNSRNPLVMMSRS